MIICSYKTGEKIKFSVRVGLLGKKEMYIDYDSRHINKYTMLLSFNETLIYSAIRNRVNTRI